MATMFVRHAVRDYRAWRKAYDELAAFQRDNGVLGQAVYQSSEDPNDVTVMHDFATVEIAREFAKRDELRQAMEQAGVTGTPTVWFTSRV